jgi:succinoglycan biosynthesis protein ExoA
MTDGVQGARVVIVVPVLNERDHMEEVVAELRGPERDIPVWVVDGGSTDGTIAMVRRIAACDPGVVLLHNRGRSQSHAVNLAAGKAMEQGFDVMVRADAHCRYAPGFARAVSGVLCRSGADSVRVPLIASDRARPGWQQANALLQRSLLGHGGAGHRKGGVSGRVAHGHHAAFLLRAFIANGGYDTGLAACEDVDFDQRLTRTGGYIRMEADWPVEYVPRPSPGAVMRQMFRNGVSRMRVARKNRIPLALRQKLPVLPVLAAILAVFGLVWPPAALLFPAYLGLVFLLAIRAGRGFAGLRIWVLAVLSHMSFGAGILWGLKPPRLRRCPSRMAVRL